MATTFKRIRALPLRGFDGLVGSRDVEYMYQGLAPGDDLFNEPWVPELGGTMRVKDTDLELSSYDLEEYIDNLGEVTGSGKLTCHYEATPANLDAQYIRWECSYKKETMRMPSYLLQPHFYVEVGSQSETYRQTWVEQGISIPIEFAVLSVTVQRISHDLSERSEILIDMAAAKAQVGHLHVFPQFGNDKWVMQPFTARQADPYRVEMSFTWVSDPGNPPPRLPASATAEQKKRLHYPLVARKPWQVYQVIPSLTLGDKDGSPKPEILLVDLYPEFLDDGSANPFYEPAGYKKLPGRPMG